MSPSSHASLRASRLALLVLLSGFLSACARGAASSGSDPDRPELRVDLDRREVAVGEPVRITILVRAAPETLLDLPRMREAPKGFLLLGQEDPVRRTEGGWQEIRLRLRVAPLAYGEHPFPLPPLRYRGSGASEWSLLEPDPPRILVRTALPDDAPLPDAAELPPPLRMRPPLPLWMFPAGGAVILAAALLLRGWRRRGREASLPPVPAHRQALRDLDALERERLVAGGRAAAFFDAYLAILRRYMLRRYGITAGNRTTEEVVRRVREEATFLDGHGDLLEAAFSTADYVRFARGEAQESDERSALEAGRRFVLETAPPEEEAGSA